MYNISYIIIYSHLSFKLIALVNYCENIIILRVEYYLVL